MKIDWNLTPVTFSQLAEVCNYQQELIEKYKEYIEKVILVKILEKDVGDPHDPLGLAMFKQVTIPQTTFMLDYSRASIAYKYLQADTDYINYILKYYADLEEREKNAKTN